MTDSTAAAPRKAGVYLAVIPAAAVVFAWAAGLSAMVRDTYHPHVPQWIIGCVIAAMIVAGMAGIPRFLNSRPGQPFRKLLLALFSCMLGALIATVFGGVWLLLADRVARRSQLLATSVLAAGLGVTVFGFGIATSMEPVHMIGVFSAGLAGLLLSQVFCKATPVGLVRFGILHFLTLFLVMVVASTGDGKGREERSAPAAASLISTPPARGPGQ